MSGRRKRTTTFNTTTLLLTAISGTLAYTLPPYRTWLILAAAAFFALFLFVNLRRHRIATTMTRIDDMDGIAFERFLTRQFKKQGYKTKHIGGGGGDYGADLIIEKKGIKIAVQAKNYTSGRVGNDAVQQAVAGASYYDCEQAMVVTNSTFTKAAKEQAEGSNIEVTLWDRRILKKWITKQG